MNQKKKFLKPKPPFQGYVGMKKWFIITHNRYIRSQFEVYTNLVPFETFWAPLRLYEPHFVYRVYNKIHIFESKF